MSQVIARQSETSQSVNPNGEGCRVLHLHMGNYGKIESADCPGIADEAAQKLAAAGAAWRDERFRLKRIADVCRELNLPPFAILQTIGKKKRLHLEAPPPLTVPFEPIELDETHPVLAGIVENLIVADGDPDDATIRRSPWYARSFVRLGAAAIVMLNMTIQAVVQTIAQSAAHGFRLWFIAMIWGIWGLVAAGCAYGLWRTSAQWLLIPGGVIIRRTFWKNVGTKLERYTPADTLLMMAPDNIGWWTSLIRKEKAIHRKRFTRMEATALLAAWQSPIPPKRLNEMSDLIR